MNKPMDRLPVIEQIRAAAMRIAPYAQVAPVMRSAALDVLSRSAGAALVNRCQPAAASAVVWAVATGGVASGAWLNALRSSWLTGIGR